MVDSILPDFNALDIQDRQPGDPPGASKDLCNGAPQEVSNGAPHDAANGASHNAANGASHNASDGSSQDESLAAPTDDITADVTAALAQMAQIQPSVLTTASNSSGQSTAANLPWNAPVGDLPWSCINPAQRFRGVTRLRLFETRNVCPRNMPHNFLLAILRWFNRRELSEIIKMGPIHGVITQEEAEEILQMFFDWTGQVLDPEEVSGGQRPIAHHARAHISTDLHFAFPCQTSHDRLDSEPLPDWWYQWDDWFTDNPGPPQPPCA